MNNKYLNDYKNLLLSISGTIITLLIALCMTVLQADFDFSKFNWLSFFNNIIFSIIGRLVFTQIAKENGYKADDIIQLKLSIGVDKKELYSTPGRIQIAENLIIRDNKINKLTEYLNKIDCKKKIPKDEVKRQEYNLHRMNIQQYIKAIKDNDIKNIEEFEKIINIDTLPVKYRKISLPAIYSFCEDTETSEHQMSVNVDKYIVRSSGGSLTGALIISLIVSAIDPNSRSAENILLNLCIYMAMYFNGCFNGYFKATRIIRNKYCPVLNNAASYLRKIKYETLEKEKELGQNGA